MTDIMIPKTLPLLAALPLLVISCDGKKPVESGTASETPAATPAETGVILAKSGHIQPPGTRVETESSMTMNDSKLHVVANDREMEGTTSNTATEKEVREFLSETKIRNTFLSRKKTGKAVIAGMERPVPDSPAPLEGKPVIIQKNDGKWVSTLESGAAEPAQEAEIGKLADPFNRESAVATYGEAPRKVGDKWDVDPSKVDEFAGMENMTGSYSMEFLRIEDYEGAPCAVLKATVDFKGKGPESTGESMSMRIRGEMTTHRSLKDMIDLQTVASGTMDLDSTPAPGVSVHVQGPFKSVRKVTLTRP
jgi:hypothetical protein